MTSKNLPLSEGSRMHSLRESLLSVYGQLVPDDPNPDPSGFWKENLLFDAPPDLNELSTMLILYSCWLSPYDPVISKKLSTLHEQIQKPAKVNWIPVKSTKVLNPSAKPFTPQGTNLSHPLKKFWEDLRWREKIKTRKIMIMEGPHAGVVGTLTYWDKIGAWVQVKNETSIFVFNKHIVRVVKES